MLPIPLISAVPIPSIFGGTIVMPAAGAFLAVVLIAALVGSALGMLREATSPPPGVTALHRAATPPAVDHGDHDEHREAA